MQSYANKSDVNINNNVSLSYVQISGCDIQIAKGILINISNIKEDLKRMKSLFLQLNGFTSKLARSSGGVFH